MSQDLIKRLDAHPHQHRRTAMNRAELIEKVARLKEDRKVALNLQATAETRVIGLSRQIRNLEREFFAASPLAPEGGEG